MRIFFGPLLTGLVVGDASLVEVDRWLKSHPESPEMQAVRKQEVSFIENTLHSMEFNQQAVLNSNRELDRQVRESERRLKQLTQEIGQMNAKTRERIASRPFSLLETHRNKLFLDQDSDDSEDETTIIAHDSKPISILEAAKARASASEKRFQEAMKKLEADRQALLKDEAMRRARAQQERRHVQI